MYNYFMLLLTQKGCHQVMYTEGYILKKKHLWTCQDCKVGALIVSYDLVCNHILAPEGDFKKNYFGASVLIKAQNITSCI